FVLSSVLTGGAVLRLSGRVFVGWGAEQREDEPEQAPQAREEEDEETVERERTPPLMVLVPAVLMAAAIVIGLIPGAVPGIELAAAHVGDHAAYIAWVLHGGVAHYLPVAPSHVETYDYIYGAVGALGAVLAAATALFAYPLRDRIPSAAMRSLLGAIGGLRRLHSGHIGDYIAWWTTGAAVFGGASLVLL